MEDAGEERWSDTESPWQYDSVALLLVLEAVAEEGAEGRAAECLSRCACVCVAWCRAASRPALWRRAAMPRAAAADLAALPHYTTEAGWWRRVAARGERRWRAAGRRGAGARLLAVALAPARDRLAITTAEGSVAIWSVSNDTVDKWQEQWAGSVLQWGWAEASRAQWNARGELLLAGPLLLASRWELCVLRLRGGAGRAVCRVRAACSAGAAGCWAGDAFLALELRRAGTMLYTTTLWLNSASQETQSEYAGVSTPLLRVFNEDSTHFSHALVAEVPLKAFELDSQWSAAAQARGDREEDVRQGPSAAYYRRVLPSDDEIYDAESTCSDDVDPTFEDVKGRKYTNDKGRIYLNDKEGTYPNHKELDIDKEHERERSNESDSDDSSEAECSNSRVRWVVCGGGSRLSAWPLRARAPPPLLAAASLAERVAARAARAAAAAAPAAPAAPDAPEPSEAAVRALCTPPDATCRLAADLQALVAHPGGTCVWAVVSGGDIWCRSLPSLQSLRRLYAPPAMPDPLQHCYIHADVDRRYVASVTSQGVWIWPVAGGARVKAAGAGRNKEATLPSGVLMLPAGAFLVVDGDSLLHYHRI